MKKQTILATAMVACLGLTSCGTIGTGAASSLLAAAAGAGTTTDATTAATAATAQTVATAGSSLLNSLLGSVLSSTLTEQSLVGTWKYAGPECRFESENLLAQAGGTIVADNIEAQLGTYLSKVGITQGSTAFTFKSDKTFTIQTGNRTIATGSYTFNSSTKVLTLTSSLGLLNQNCIVGMDGTNLCMLFEANKLLTATNAVATLLGKTNTTVGSVASMVGQNYQGMKLGFKLAK